MVRQLWVTKSKLFKIPFSWKCLIKDRGDQKTNLHNINVIQKNIIQHFYSLEGTI